MNLNHVSALAAAGLFAIGAVVLIIMQHNQATASVLSQLGATATASGSGIGANGLLGVSASLAGSPTAGQAGSSFNPAVIPLNINPGYTLQ